MQLFHHAFSSTAHSLAADEWDIRFWNSELPQIATMHGYVMDGLLAVAALHMASLDPEKSSFWFQTSLVYQSRATVGLRHDLENNSRDFKAAFTASALIVVMVKASPTLRNDEHHTDPLREVMTIRSILKGCKVTFSHIAHTEEADNISLIRRDGTHEKVTISEEYGLYREFPIQS